ncbi:MAG: hypothetical protein II837_10720 [Treponema sp.]|nr:hypothetical protein [Treponema sp.]
MGTALKVTGLILGGVAAGIIFSLNKENLNLVDDYNKLHDEYNDLVNEWNEKVAAKKSGSPNPHWKHYTNPHDKPEVNVIRRKDAVDEDGTRHRVYTDLSSGTKFTVLGG